MTSPHDPDRRRATPSLWLPFALSLVLAWIEVAYRSGLRGHYLLTGRPERAELLALSAGGALVFAVLSWILASAVSRSLRPPFHHLLGATFWVWGGAGAADHLARNVIASPFRWESAFGFGAILVGVTLAAMLVSRGVGRSGARFLVDRRGGFGLLVLLGLLGAIAVLGGGSIRPPTRPEGAAARPDVILVSIDTARADLISIGRRLPAPDADPDPVAPPMPELDRLAEEGTAFRRAVAQENWTLPSHASILTSLYPAVHGVEDLDSRLADSTRTLAEVFAAAGYRSLGLVDGDPKGFVGARRGFDRGFDDYVHFPDGRGLGEATLPGRVWSDLLLFTDRGHAEDLVGSAIRWLRADDPRPAFLFLHIYDVHSSWGATAPVHRWPYMARSGYLREIGRNRPARDRFVLGGKSGSRFIGEVNDRIDEGSSPGELLPGADLGLLHDLYRSSARYVDGELGRIWDHLRAGESRPSVVAVTADHGEEFLEHGKLGHEQEYDECLRVPLVLHGADPLSRGRRVEEVVETIDIGPTLLALADLESPAVFQGRSLLPLLRDDSGEDPPEGVGSAANRTERPGRWGSELDEIFGLRSRSHSYFVRRKDAIEELYDLRADPGETRDLTGLPEAAVLLDSLRNDVALWRRANLDRREGGGRIELDAATRERLRSLGYIR